MPGRASMVVGGVVCALIVTGALAADVAVRGRRMVVREYPAGEVNRRVVIVGRAPTASATFAAPVAGVYLRVYADGGEGAQSQLFFLEPEGWSPVSGGYRYSGHEANESPVEEVVVTVEPGKRARIRAVLNGGLGTESLDLVPPDPGTSGGLSIGTTGDVFCVVFGGDAGGTTHSDSPSVWRIRQATGDVSCPPVPTPGPTPVWTPTPQVTPSPTPTSGATTTLRPSASGTYGQWGEAFPPVGANHWQNVADFVPDDAATFIQDNTWSGVEKDTFQHEASLLLPAAIVDGVEVCVRARQTDVNGFLENNGIRILVRSASGEAEHLATAQLPAAWTTYCKTWSMNPITLEPWTVASVDALEIGARNAMSPAGPDGVQLTQVWMVVGYTP
jgi:hypothetical protein